MDSFQFQLEFGIQTVKMFNRQRSDQSKSNDGRSSSNNDLEERRAHTNAIFDQMLHASRYASDNSSGRATIDASEQTRARRLADAKNEARLAPVNDNYRSYDSYQNNRNFDNYRSYDREREIEAEVNRTRARMCALETASVRAMEEERRRMNVNWCGRSNPSSSGSQNLKSKDNKK